MQRILMKKKISFKSVHPDLEISHPGPSSRFIPEWYRTSKSFVDGTETLKKCVPFLDSMTTGYTLTLASDIFFNKGVAQDISVTGVVQTHSDNQIGDLKIPTEYYKTVYKWINSFILKTPKGYSTLFIHPANRIDLPFYSFSGLVDTDKFPIEVNFPFLIKKDFVGIIPAGTPIAQAILIKREDWESSIDDSSSYNQPAFVHTMHNPPFNFYKRKFWTRKKYS
jgi:hypothetical protein